MQADMKAMTPGERRFIKRRVCGWCEIPLSASSCGSMYAADDDRCDMIAKRATALESYKPRAAATPIEGADSR